MGVIVDIAGKRYGRLVAQTFVRREGQYTLWRCRCDCGTDVVVPAARLKTGDSRSCGCLKQEYHSRRSRFDYKSKEYRTWSLMQQRCANPNSPSYKFYGARGIRVANVWSGRGGFAAFLAEVGMAPSPDHSIDRILPSKNYEPGNCRWATALEQGNNQQREGIAFDGETKTLMEWARGFNMNYHTLYGRIHAYGMSFAEAVSRPCGPFVVEPKQTKEYATWAKMKQRCKNGNDAAFRYYGGRGIGVWPAWQKSFELFLSDVGPAPSPKHTLDRIDTSNGYQPGNCRWATRREQSVNRRDTVWLEHAGRGQCLSDWSRELGINITTLRNRLAAGKSLSAIIGARS